MTSRSVLDVTHWPAIGDEHVGKKPKQWLLNPDDDSQWLWKGVTSGLTREQQPYLKGDDWAECLASLAAESLGVSCARVEAARRSGVPGTVSAKFTGFADLMLGNVLLTEFDDEYPSSAERFDSNYTVDRVLGVLEGVEGPIGSSLSTAEANFAGYLVLDGWIGNSDRHHQNWGILIGPDDARLAPSFDHASSLGFLLHDGERSVRLDSADRAQRVEAWADRARTPFGRQHPCDVAIAALGLVGASAARHWLERLERALDALDDLFSAMPDGCMSEVSSAFAERVLRHNGSRMLSHPSRTLMT